MKTHADISELDEYESIFQRIKVDNYESCERRNARLRLALAYADGYLEAKYGAALSIYILSAATFIYDHKGTLGVAYMGPKSPALEEAFIAAWSSECIGESDDVRFNDPHITGY